MDAKKSIKYSIKLLQENRTIWAIAILVALLEIVAISVYAPFGTGGRYFILLISIPILIGEAAILHLAAQHKKEREEEKEVPVSTFDGFMYAAVSFFHLAAVKFITFLPFGFLIVAFLYLAVVLLPFVFENNPILFGFYTLVIVIPIIFAQVWSCFAIVSMMTDEYPIGEAIYLGLGLMKSSALRLLPLILGFLLLDILILSLLWATETITYDSIFIVEVTQQMVDDLNLDSTLPPSQMGDPGVGGIFTFQRFADNAQPQAGEFFFLDRFSTGLIAAGLKTRILDIGSIFYGSVSNFAVGLIVVILQAVVLPFRLLPCLMIYLEEEPRLMDHANSITKNGVKTIPKLPPKRD